MKITKTQLRRLIKEQTGLNNEELHEQRQELADAVDSFMWEVSGGDEQSEEAYAFAANEVRDIVEKTLQKW